MEAAHPASTAPPYEACHHGAHFVATLLSHASHRMGGCGQAVEVGDVLGRAIDLLAGRRVAWHELGLGLGEGLLALLVVVDNIPCGRALAEVLADCG